MTMLYDHKIMLGGACGAVTVTNTDGLKNYKLDKTNKNVILGEEDINGNAQIKFKLANSGTLTLTVVNGSDLEMKLATASNFNLPFIGTLLDERNEAQIKSYSFKGALSKPNIEYSADSTDYEILGNFIQVVI